MQITIEIPDNVPPSFLAQQIEEFQNKLKELFRWKNSVISTSHAFDLSAYMAEVRTNTENMPMTPSVIDEMREDARY